MQIKMSGMFGLDIKPFQGRRTWIPRAVGIALFYVEAIPLFWAYIINFILDFTDCPIGTYTGLARGKPEKCDSGIESYQIPDKIMDTIVDLAALNIMVKEESPLTQSEKNFFIFLFVIRFIGVLLFIYTKDEKWLIVFPHFFSITLLYRFAFETFEPLKDKNPWAKSNIWILIVLYILKFGQEILWHKK